ncbi:unnamed protein product [Owenia fusiformis]|uniref:Uncharacterized protein n=1 Tax=Owenia fusiformis TaxID=6347 RepID=A0A8S4P7F5_OWEFU|nr:unnamed protein product [Owenia fusiformis]
MKETVLRIVLVKYLMLMTADVFGKEVFDKHHDNEVPNYLDDYNGMINPYEKHNSGLKNTSGTLHFDFAKRQPQSTYFSRLYLRKPRTFLQRDKREARERQPCPTLYLDSKMKMSAEIATSSDNWFGVWVLDQNKTFNRAPVYEHETSTENSTLYFYKMMSDSWVIASEIRQTDSIRELEGFKGVAIAKNSDMYPEDIQTAMQVYSEEKEKVIKWPGLFSTCVSVENSCRDIFVSGFDRKEVFMVFNGLWHKDGSSGHRPSYTHNDNFTLILKYDTSTQTWTFIRETIRKSGSKFDVTIAGYDFTFEPQNARYDWKNVIKGGPKRFKDTNISCIIRTEETTVSRATVTTQTQEFGVSKTTVHITPRGVAAVTTENSTHRTPVVKDQIPPECQPCPVLYLDSKQTMLEAVAASNEWFGVWTLDRTREFNGEPVYKCETSTVAYSYYLYNVLPNIWVIATEIRQSDVLIDIFGLRGRVIIATDGDIFPRSNQNPVQLYTATDNTFMDWPGLSFSCVSVENTCDALSVSGFDRKDDFTVFNGLWHKEGASASRPAYVHNVNSTLSLKYDNLTLKWTFVREIVKPKRSVFSSIIVGNDFTFEPQNVRYGWENVRGNLKKKFESVKIECLLKDTKTVSKPVITTQRPVCGSARTTEQSTFRTNDKTRTGKFVLNESNGYHRKDGLCIKMF